MTWFNSGDWDGLQVGTGVTDMLLDLCLAVNERETLQGLTLTVFEINTGFKIANPVRADFVDMLINDAILLNFWRIRGAIDGFATSGSWAKSSVDRDRFTTTAELLNAAGDGPSWRAITRPSDKAMWEQMRDALTLLKYPYWVFGMDTVPSWSDGKRGFYFTHNGSRNIASWDSAVLDKDGPISGGSLPRYWHETVVIAGGHKTRCFIQKLVPTADWLTSGIVGTLLQGKKSYTVKVTWNDKDITWDHDGDSFTHDHTGSGFQGFTFDKGTSFPNIGSDTPSGTFAITSPDEIWPDDPWNELGGGQWIPDAEVVTVFGEAWTDISSLLVRV